MLKSARTLSLVLSLLVSGLAHAVYIEGKLDNLKNDKEVVITTLKKKEVEGIRNKYKDGRLPKLLDKVFKENLQEYLDDNYNKCELRFISTFRAKLRDKLLKDDEASVREYIKILRVHHYIDDILYEIMAGLNKDHFRLDKIDLVDGPNHTILPRKKLLKANDLKKLYVDFKTWPDEYSSCSYNDYIILKKSIKTKNGGPSKKAKEMKILNKKAYEAGIIPLFSYVRLEYLRKESNINDRTIWLDDYLDIIFKAKNKMRPISYHYEPVSIDKENSFSSEKLRRFYHITRRKRLYEKYDETQIIMLSQVLQKASRRMGVDPDTQSKAPVISQEFSVLQPSGERETYVERIELDSQSQYNLARRLLRKDILELQMMDSFIKLKSKITYEDVVMAALETGYISLEDIEYVVKYDDLWNPQKSPFEKVIGFIFRVAGYGSFFLPPPWNVTASIAMGVAEGLIGNKLFKTGAENDNAATFIE